MVSARTASFFALIIAAAPQIFASPLPLVHRVDGDVSEFSTIKAYERRALPEVVPTSSDGVIMRMYGTRAIGDIGTTGDVATATTTTATTTTGSVTGALAPAPADIVTIPAELAVSSDGSGAKPIVVRRNSLLNRGFFGIVSDPAEHTNSKRAEGINLMPAEVATSSDGVTMKVFGRGFFSDLVPAKAILPNPEDHVSISDNIAVSSDGTGPVAIGKRAEGINLMPAEVATSSDGVTMKVFGRGFFSDLKPAEAILPNPEDNVSISDNIAVSSDGTGPVAIGKRAEGINLMPEEVATTSDGVTMKTYQRRQVVAAGTLATTATTDTVGSLGTVAAVPVTDPTDPTDGTDDESTAILPSPDDIVNVPAEVAVSSDGTGPVPLKKRAEGINLMPAEVATSSDGVTMKVFGQ